jgi:signal transduction histidine kinase/CheY-like chemotaxis protein
MGNLFTTNNNVTSIKNIYNHNNNNNHNNNVNSLISTSEIKNDINNELMYRLNEFGVTNDVYNIWVSPPRPGNESERGRQLMKYNITNKDVEPEFDAICLLVKEICKTSMVLISLVKSDKQIFKSKIGLDIDETLRCDSFCGYTILRPNELLYIKDTKKHPLFRHNPFVIDGLKIRMYAGMPLTNSEGYAIGTICLLDTSPRKLSKVQLNSLYVCSKQIMNQIELRHKLSLERNLIIIKSKFLSSMSHEIRNPLNSIIGAANLLSSEGLNADSREMVDVVKSSSEHLFSVINDVLDLSKFESNTFKLEEESVCLYDLVEKTIKLIDNKKKLSIMYNIDSTLPHYVLSDSIRLKQVLLNLLSNAYKFTDEASPNKIWITIKKVKTLDRKFNVKIGVHDTGIGIPTDKIKNLFNEYEQIDISRTKKYGGSGLGLSICKQIMQLFKGKIYITPQAIGSAFYFEFPLNEVTNELVNDKQHDLVNDENYQCICKNIDIPLKMCILYNETNQWLIDYWNNWLTHYCPTSNILTINLKDFKKYPDIFDVIITDLKNLVVPTNVKLLQINHSYKASRLIKELNEMITSSTLRDYELITIPKKVKVEIKIKKKIMIVEDNLLNQKILKRMLENLGYETIIVNNGQECLNVIKNINPNLIFMDIIMPVMDGLTATKLIRENKNLIQPIIIALTANSNKEDIEETKFVGMNDFLSKPIHQVRLKEVLLQYL